MLRPPKQNNGNNVIYEVDIEACTAVKKICVYKDKKNLLWYFLKQYITAYTALRDRVNIHDYWSGNQP